jgi:hypothetical protein
MMGNQIDISIETLRRAASVLLDRLESGAGATVALDKDMFWSIPAEQRSNVYAEPTEFTIGQLSESLQNVSRVVEDPSSATSYALVWLADLLRAAGEAVIE